VDRKAWQKECEELEEYFKLFGDHFPKALHEELHQLKARITD
jgi:GTP-dependent phosphoenolpyruvate carboxykinase